MSARPAFHQMKIIGPYLLSARELEVAKSLARGETIMQIAERLGVNQSAVSNYRSRAEQKLGLYNRFQLAAYAKEAGWV